MSKAVLISIQPKWCELISLGKKTVEVRKTKPKLEMPFKVYIYETQGKLKWCNKCQDTDCERPYPNCACHEGWGKVIGEFVCKKVENIEIRHFTVFGHENRYTAVGENPDYQWLKKSCLSYDEVAHYGNFAPLYGWHISDLVIYDKPRELSEFCKPCNDSYDPMYGSYCKYCDRRNKLTRPPQSWCYVEEGADNEQREAD